MFDQNLSHRLVAILEDLFPGSQHVRSVGLAEADDLDIWEYAICHHFVVVTQDSDYADWNKLRGSPPLDPQQLPSSAKRLASPLDPALEISIFSQ